MKGENELKLKITCECPCKHNNNYDDDDNEKLWLSLSLSLFGLSTYRYWRVQRMPFWQAIECQRQPIWHSLESNHNIDKIWKISHKLDFHLMNKKKNSKLTNSNKIYIIPISLKSILSQRGSPLPNNCKINKQIIN